MRAACPSLRVGEGQAVQPYGPAGTSNVHCAHAELPTLSVHWAVTVYSRPSPPELASARSQKVPSPSSMMSPASATAHHC